MSQQTAFYVFLLSYSYSRTVNPFTDFRFIIYLKTNNTGNQLQNFKWILGTIIQTILQSVQMDSHRFYNVMDLPILLHRFET